ncbi:MAG: DUF4251 domain-containing protein [Bacteroidales bacterium]|nr:DUF4251 domain-containing protein [Bacteroidales bacterium]
MKTKILKITALAIIPLLLCHCSSLSRKVEERRDRREKEIIEGYADIKDMVHSGLYEFTATRAYPSGYSSMDISSTNNYLTVRYYDVEAFMPFFGVRHMIDSKMQPGIRIDSKMEDLMIEESDNRHRVLVSFNARGESDKYSIMMDIGPDSNARLTVYSAKTSTISYHGTVSPIEPGMEEEENK